MILYELTIEQELEVLRTLMECHNTILHDETREYIRRSIRKVAESLACRVCYVERN